MLTCASLKSRELSFCGNPGLNGIGILLLEVDFDPCGVCRADSTVEIQKGIYAEGPFGDMGCEGKTNTEERKTRLDTNKKKQKKKKEKKAHHSTHLQTH